MEHITLVLKTLHWLPISYRSQYKLMMYTYRALNDTDPVYLKELVVPYQPTRSLRSASESSSLCHGRAHRPMENAASIKQLHHCGIVCHSLRGSRRLLALLKNQLKQVFSLRLISSYILYYSYHHCMYAFILPVLILYHVNSFYAL